MTNEIELSSRVKKNLAFARATLKSKYIELDELDNKRKK